MSAWYLRLLPCQSCHKGPTWTAPWICVYFFRWGRNQKAVASLRTQTEGKARQVIGERLTRHPGDIHTDRRAASVFMRWSIPSISFLRPPGCVKWAVWEQTHGKMLRNSINIHKIFLDKLISNYLENAMYRSFSFISLSVFYSQMTWNTIAPCQCFFCFFLSTQSSLWACMDFRNPCRNASDTDAPSHH